MKIEDLVHRLQDYELALLVSLIAGEHCIITAEADQLDQLEDAIEQVPFLFSLELLVHSVSLLEVLSF